MWAIVSALFFPVYKTEQSLTKLGNSRGKMCVAVETTYFLRERVYTSYHPQGKRNWFTSKLNGFFVPIPRVKYLATHEDTFPPSERESHTLKEGINTLTNILWCFNVKYMLLQVNHRPLIPTENLLPFLAASLTVWPHPLVPFFPAFISPLLHHLCPAAPRSTPLTCYWRLSFSDQQRAKDFCSHWKFSRDGVIWHHWHNHKNLALLFGIKTTMVKRQVLRTLCSRSSFPVWKLVSFPIICGFSRFRLPGLEDWRNRVSTLLKWFIALTHMEKVTFNRQTPKAASDGIYESVVWSLERWRVSPLVSKFPLWRGSKASNYAQIPPTRLYNAQKKISLPINRQSASTMLWKHFFSLIVRLFWL